MAKTKYTYMVKAFNGTGYTTIATCNTAIEADKHIVKIVREQGVPCTDFIVKRVIDAK